MSGYQNFCDEKGPHCLLCMIALKYDEYRRYDGQGDGGDGWTYFTYYYCLNQKECFIRVNEKLKPSSTRIIFYSKNAHEQSGVAKYQTTDKGIVDCTCICDYDKDKDIDPKRYGYYPNDTQFIGIFENPVCVLNVHGVDPREASSKTN
jgi:hypothetical protein